MGQKTKIQWTDSTWNPAVGCTPASPGCDNCYARSMIKRYAGCPGWPGSPGEVTLFPDRLEIPFRWKKPRRIFVCSMSDLFHDDVPVDYVAAVFGVMAANPQHQFMVLTKRPDNMLEFFRWVQICHCQTDAMEEIEGPRLECADCLLSYEIEYHPKGDSGPIHCKWGPNLEGPWPLPNVWLGVTAENQEMADERIPLLLQCPAKKHFVSVEPMLGPIDPTMIRDGSWYDGEGADYYDALRGAGWWSHGDYGLRGGPKLDWVICGGESGPGARQMDPAWARSLRDQCKSAGISFFMKQMSKKAPIPDDLMIREIP